MSPLTRSRCVVSFDSDTLVSPSSALFTPVSKFKTGVKTCRSGKGEMTVHAIRIQRPNACETECTVQVNLPKSIFTLKAMCVAFKEQTRFHVLALDFKTRQLFDRGLFVILAISSRCFTVQKVWSSAKDGQGSVFKKKVVTSKAEQAQETRKQEQDAVMITAAGDSFRQPLKVDPLVDNLNSFPRDDTLAKNDTFAKTFDYTSPDVNPDLNPYLNKDLNIANGLNNDSDPGLNQDVDADFNPDLNQDLNPDFNQEVAATIPVVAETWTLKKKKLERVKAYVTPFAASAHVPPSASCIVSTKVYAPRTPPHDFVKTMFTRTPFTALALRAAHPHPPPLRPLRSGLRGIPTTYKGITFRSILESRFARLMDELNVRYVYEPVQYNLTAGGTYCIDFFLPVQQLFVELKPKRPHIEEELKCEQMSEKGFRVTLMYGSGVEKLPFLSLAGKPFRDYKHHDALRGITWINGTKIPGDTVFVMGAHPTFKSPLDVSDVTAVHLNNLHSVMDNRWEHPFIVDAFSKLSRF